MFRKARPPKTPARPGAAPLTCGELNAAVAAVQNAGLDPDGKTIRMLKELRDLLSRHTDAWRGDTAASVPDGPLSVTCAEVEAAIEEVQQLHSDGEVDADVLRQLRAALALLADAEEARAPVDAVPVTCQQLDDLLQVLAIVVDNIERARDRAGHADGSVRYRLARIAKHPSEFGLSDGEHTALRLFNSLLDTVAAADDAAARRRARGHHGLGSQPWDTI